MDFKYTVISYNSGTFETLINNTVIMEKNIDIFNAGSLPVGQQG